MLLKIGELAKRTALTVRTLHHYDAIGLLCPSARSDAGYRLYNREDVERLHRVQALRRLDIPLADIAALLEGDSADLQSVIDQQIAALDRQVKGAMALRDRLHHLRLHLGSKEEPDLSEWLMTLELMSMYDKYFTSDELDRLRRSGLGAKPELIAVVAALRELMERGVPPESAEALALAKPWLVLSLEKMGGDARLILKLDAMHRTESSVQVLTGVDAELLDYMILATAEFRLSLYARHLGAADMARIRRGYLEHYRRWPELFGAARALYERGADPRGMEVQALCSRWLALFQASFGTDPQLHEKLRNAIAREPDIMAGSGMSEGAMRMLKQGIEYLTEQKQQEAT